MLDEHKTNFERWFGDSKVVDSLGQPMVVFHSGSFDESDNSIPIIGVNGFHFGTQAAAEARVHGKYVEDEASKVDVYEEDGRFYLDDEWSSAPSNGFISEEDAKSWLIGEINRWDLEIEEVSLTRAYLSIKNPKRVTDQHNDWSTAVSIAKEEGYDGIVYRNMYEDKGKDSYIVFDARQIKSATLNSGVYAKDNPSIIDKLDAAENALRYLSTLNKPREIPRV